MAPQAFHCFPHLAPELQELIWQHAIYSIPPRIVELRNNFWTTLKPSDDQQAIQAAGGLIANTTHGLHKLEWQYTSPCYIPTPLHVCSVSRELALRRWRLSFADDEKGEKHGKKKKRRIYFDFQTDVLWVGAKVPSLSGLVNVVGKEEGSGLRRLAFDFDDQLQARNSRSARNLAMILMGKFPLLEEVVCVGCERKEGGGEKKMGLVTFVENVDGAEDAFWVTKGVELDAFRDACTREGRHIVLKYMDYTREDPKLFQTVGKLQWLQMED